MLLLARMDGMTLAAGVMRPGFPNIAIHARVAYSSQQRRKQITITTTMNRMRCSQVRPIPLLMLLTWVGKRHKCTINTAHTGSRRSCMEAPGVAALGMGWKMGGSSEILLAGEELANVGRIFSSWYRTIGFRIGDSAVYPEWPSPAFSKLHSI